MGKNYQTIIVLDHEEQIAEVSTDNRKWINRMVKLEAEGHAEEVDASVEGNQEWECEIGLFRLPFHRTPRTWTKKQKEEARERLAAVREKVAADREADAEDEDDEEEEAPAPKKKPTRKRKAKKAKPAPEPVEEEEDEDDVEDEDEDEDEPEEVVVKKPVRRRRKKKTS